MFSVRLHCILRGFCAKAEIFLPSLIPWYTAGLRHFENFTWCMETVDQCGWGIWCGMWIKKISCHQWVWLLPRGQEGDTWLQEWVLSCHPSQQITFPIWEFPVLVVSEARYGSGGEGASPHPLLVSARLPSGGALSCFGRTDPAHSNFFLNFLFTFSYYLTGCCCCLRNTNKGKEVAFFSCCL